LNKYSHTTFPKTFSDPLKNYKKNHHQLNQSSVSSSWARSLNLKLLPFFVFHLVLAKFVHALLVRTHKFHAPHRLVVSRYESLAGIKSLTPYERRTINPSGCLYLITFVSSVCPDASVSSGFAPAFNKHCSFVEAVPGL
jgi:hypothetical protein